MKQIFDTCKRNPKAKIVVFVDGEPYFLEPYKYIEDNDWLWKASKNERARMNSADLIFSVELEAEDECWGDDIYVAPIDACLNGDFYVCIEGDPGDTNVDYYKFSNIVEGPEEIAISVRSQI